VVVVGADWGTVVDGATTVTLVIDGAATNVVEVVEVDVFDVHAVITNARAVRLTTPIRIIPPAYRQPSPILDGRMPLADG
jgi:hypothetical protein